MFYLSGLGKSVDDEMDEGMHLLFTQFAISHVHLLTNKFIIIYTVIYIFIKQYGVCVFRFS